MMVRSGTWDEAVLASADMEGLHHFTWNGFLYMSVSAP